MKTGWDISKKKLFNIHIQKYFYQPMLLCLTRLETTVSPCSWKCYVASGNNENMLFLDKNIATTPFHKKLRIRDDWGVIDCINIYTINIYVYISIFVKVLHIHLLFKHMHGLHTMKNVTMQMKEIHIFCSTLWN